MPAIESAARIPQASSGSPGGRQRTGRRRRRSPATYASRKKRSALRESCSLSSARPSSERHPWHATLPSDRYAEQAAIPNEIGELAKEACFPLIELVALLSPLKSGPAQYQPRLISDPSISS